MKSNLGVWKDKLVLYLAIVSNVIACMQMMQFTPKNRVQQQRDCGSDPTKMKQRMGSEMNFAKTGSVCRDIVGKWGSDRQVLQQKMYVFM
ncbi:hypothetical protein [Novipirellula herctigrandis]